MAKRALPADTKRLVAERAAGCCEYCLSQQQFATHPFSIDHVVPLDLGGSDESDNLALCCQGCNNYKFNHTRALDPKTGESVPLYHPRQDIWQEHFQWNENFTVIIGTSPTGRATVTALKLNRDSLMRQRVMYRAYGVHPPQSGGDC
jgi:hypothetical protein